MPLIFLSHASDDKTKVSPVVDELIKAGFQIWLDNPGHKDLNYSPDFIRTHFYRILPHTEWREAIDEGLMAADGVVMCWSSRALEPTEKRFEWLYEARQGLAMEKLYSCRIDDFDPGELKHGFSSLQMADLRTGPTFEKMLRLFVGDVKIKIEERSRSRLKDKQRLKVARDELGPYLINRERQEAAVTSAAIDVETKGGVRPFLIMGPENEGLDHFLERLERRSIRQRLPSRNTWDRYMVKWPDGEVDTFADDYRTNLLYALKMPASASYTDIAHKLNRSGRPVACHSLLLASDWSRQEPQRIRRWLLWWEELAKGPLKLAVIPLITLKTPPVKPGWERFPPGTAEGASVSYADMWGAIEKLSRGGSESWLKSIFWPEPKTIPLGAPPILHPVRANDAELWLSSCGLKLRSEAHDRATSIIGSLFASPSARKFGVSLLDFAREVKPLFDGRG